MMILYVRLLAPHNKIKMHVRYQRRCSRGRIRLPLSDANDKETAAEFRRVLSNMKKGLSRI
jgi:hypothetical protein